MSDQSVFRRDELLDTSPTSLYKLNHMLRNLFQWARGLPIRPGAICVGPADGVEVTTHSFALEVTDDAAQSTVARLTGDAAFGLCASTVSAGYIAAQNLMQQQITPLTLTVDPDGGADFLSIQAALDSLPKHLAAPVTITMQNPTATLYGDTLLTGFSGSSLLMVDLANTTQYGAVTLRDNTARVFFGSTGTARLVAYRNAGPQILVENCTSATLRGLQLNGMGRASFNVRCVDSRLTMDTLDCIIARNTVLSHEHSQVFVADCRGASQAGVWCIGTAGTAYLSGTCPQGTTQATAAQILGLATPAAGGGSSGLSAAQKIFQTTALGSYRPLDDWHTGEAVAGAFQTHEPDAAHTGVLIFGSLRAGMSGIARGDIMAGRLRLTAKAQTGLWPPRPVQVYLCDKTTPDGAPPTRYDGTDETAVPGCIASGPSATTATFDLPRELVRKLCCDAGCGSLCVYTGDPQNYRVFISAEMDIIHLA